MIIILIMNLVISGSFIQLFDLDYDVNQISRNKNDGKKRKNGLSSNTRYENEINLAIQTSGIITENYDQFREGISTNLTISEENGVLLEKSIEELTWKEITLPENKPSERMGHKMVYNSKSDKYILFGGTGTEGLKNDTWIYDPQTNIWTEKAPSVAPAARYYHDMVYDPKQDKVILFGGYLGGSQLGDTWAYDLITNTWSEMNPSVKPSPRYFNLMIYDSFSEIVLLFGGRAGASNYRDTWIYDLGSDNWTNMNPPTSPPTRIAGAMAYNSLSNKVILFGGHVGGSSFLTDTWIYEVAANNWTQMFPDTSPGARRLAGVCFDTSIAKTVIFGGYGASRFGDTWTYDLVTNTWNQLDPSITPPARDSHTMVYDSNSENILVFGGLSGSYLNDAWIYPEEKICRTGILQSRIIPLGNIYNITGNLIWDPLVQPLGTSLKLQIGFSNTTHNEDFVYTNLTTTEMIFTRFAQYLCYNVTFESDIDQLISPNLKTLTIEYRLDNPQPEIEIINPPNNSIVEGLVSITVLASSPNGITKVAFFLGGTLLVYDYTAPFKFTWDTRGVNNGNVSLSVIATTVLGRENIDSIQLTVDNPITPELIETTSSPPQNLLAIVDDYFIILDWTPPSNNGGSAILYYKIYRGTISGEYSEHGISSKTNYTDTTVSSDTRYYYVVTAVNDIGESYFSEETSSIPTGVIEPTHKAPSIPRFLSVNAEDQIVTLTWTPPSDDGGVDIIKYHVYRGTSSGSYMLIGVVIGALQRYNDSLIIRGDTYYYVVTAVNSFGESQFSNEVSITIPGAAAGTFPGLFTVLLSLIVIIGITRKRK